MIELEFKQTGRRSKKNKTVKQTNIWNYNQRQLSRNKNDQYTCWKGSPLPEVSTLGHILGNSLDFNAIEKKLIITSG